MQELDAIMKLHPYESILIIDDWLSIGTKDRGFKGEDWTHFHLDTLFEIVCRNRIKNVFSIGSMFKRKAPDMLVILLKEIA